MESRAAEASASGASPAAAVQSPNFTLELRALAGGAGVELTKEGFPVVDYAATTLGVGARAGGYLHPSLLIGGAASIARYSRSGELDVRDTETFADEYWSRETSYTLVSPLSVFIELHPYRGLFFGASLGFGYVPAPDPAPGTTTFEVYAFGYSFELGYETSRSRPHGFGAFLRLAGWSGSESFLATDYPEGIGSTELTLGARWSFTFFGQAP